MNQPLLSVIVPCYNVEKYVDKCISSIVNQTYSNLEIILIDDGSTDSTGIICDTWQERDQRIRVIHKQNEGVSYARKTGVENAVAEYVVFVDADDWIDKDMYLNMMNALLSTNSDIAQCGVCDVFEDGSLKHRSSEIKDCAFEIVDRIKGVLLILEDKEWQSYMWNKIFKKHLFDHIEFPKGRQLLEDVSIAHILFHRASQTVYLRDEYYFYFRRSGSITKSKNIVDLKFNNWHDMYNVYCERYRFVEQHPEYHSCLILAKNKAVFCGMIALRYSIIYPQFYSKNFCNSFRKYIHSIGFTQKEMMKKYFKLSLKLELLVFLYSSACYKNLFKLYAKIRNIHLNISTLIN